MSENLLKNPELTESLQGWDYTVWTLPGSSYPGAGTVEATPQGAHAVLGGGGYDITILSQWVNDLIDPSNAHTYVLAPPTTQIENVNTEPADAVYIRTGLYNDTTGQEDVGRAIGSRSLYVAPGQWLQVWFGVRAPDHAVDVTVGGLSLTVSDPNPAPVPAFTFNTVGSYTVDFDSTISTISTTGARYSWDFGDGKKATSKNPSHNFDRVGTYDVTLTITDPWSDAGPQSVTQTVTITGPADVPTIVASFDPNDARAVQYSVREPDNRFVYTWDFGDGTSGSGLTPYHVYPGPGTYTATVTMNSTPEVSDTHTVTLSDPAVDPYRPDLPVGSEVLRLEVEWPSANQVNLIQNPNGDGGTYGWVTPDPDVRMTSSRSSGRSTLRVEDMTVNTNHLIEFFTIALPVTPGRYVGGSLLAFHSTGRDIRSLLLFQDVNGASVASTATESVHPPVENSNNGTRIDIPFVQVPVGATHVKIRFQLPHDVGDVTSYPDEFRFREATLVEENTPVTGQGYVPVGNLGWVDVLGPTNNIRVVRGALNVGTLTVEVLDSVLDPRQSAEVRPGKKVRLQAKVDDVWQTVFSGEIATASVTYVGGTRVRLTAVDNIRRLANYPSPWGVNSIDNLPVLLEETGVPYTVNGVTSADGVIHGAIASHSERASVLDQVAISRDTEQGYAWVTRDNRLAVFTTRPNTVAAVLDETTYSDLDVDLNTEALINSVVVKWQRYDSLAGENVETVYGPYEDNNSINIWGRYRREFVMHGSVEDPAVIEAKANTILASNANPLPQVHGLSLPIRYKSLDSKVLLDLYALVNVVHAESGTDENLRVTGIEHQIQPGRWTMHLSFDADDSVAAPQRTGYSL